MGRALNLDGMLAARHLRRARRHLDNAAKLSPQNHLWQEVALLMQTSPC